MAKGEGKTREEILRAIRDMTLVAGRAPSRVAFTREYGIPESRIRRFFGNWNGAIVAAGLPPKALRVRLKDPILLACWGTLVRRLGVVPTAEQFRAASAQSPEGVFIGWRMRQIPGLFRAFAADKPEWSDVVAILDARAAWRFRSDATARLLPRFGTKRKELPAAAESERMRAVPPRELWGVRRRGRPTYGSPIDFRGLRHEPVNELGVVVLFAMIARELGYLIEAIQAGFPDCDAKRCVGPSHWQRVRIEFEYESRSFKAHGHPIDGCDVIVCWRHNWAQCPKSIEVIELARVIAEMQRGEAAA
ncbi:MAG TPA: hypothetical protein VG797_05295 [Phycisphaerales bacterium]|nr:hypothetical protein [Phycisphaerales bacterium]